MREEVTIEFINDDGTVKRRRAVIVREAKVPAGAYLRDPGAPTFKWDSGLRKAVLVEPE